MLGTIWLGGLNSSTLPLPPATTGKAIPHADAIDKLKTTAEYLYGLKFSAGEIESVREGVCFRLVTPNGVPIIAKVPQSQLGCEVSGRDEGHGGVWIVAGHGPWGISLSLGTGKVVSEMLRGETLSADISGLGLQEGSVTEWQVRARLQNYGVRVRSKSMRRGFEVCFWVRSHG